MALGGLTAFGGTDRVLAPFSTRSPRGFHA